MTGGRSVLHHQELTYSFASDISLFTRSVIQTYKILSQPLVNSFKRLGLSPKLGQQNNHKSTSMICFKEVSAYEIVVNNKKIVGSAQFRNQNRFLQHGSIPLDINWELWKGVWGLDDDAVQLKDRITSLKIESANTLDPLDLVTIMLQEFSRCLDMEVQIHSFSTEEIQIIEEISGKYIW